jgi:hypothetical protein
LLNLFRIELGGLRVLACQLLFAFDIVTPWVTMPLPALALARRDCGMRIGHVLLQGGVNHLGFVDLVRSLKKWP